MNQEADVKSADVPLAHEESFDAFYKRFHADSGFQLSRVSFPLPGFDSEQHYSSEEEIDSEPETLGGEPVNKQWTKDEWELNHSVDTSVFKVRRAVSDSLVTEEILIPDSDFIVTRKFIKRDGLWYLVYYSE